MAAAVRSSPCRVAQMSDTLITEAAAEQGTDGQALAIVAWHRQ